MKVNIATFQPIDSQLFGKLSVSISEFATTSLKRPYPPGEVFIIWRQFKTVLRNIDGKLVTNAQSQMLE